MRVFVVELTASTVNTTIALIQFMLYNTEGSFFFVFLFYECLPACLFDLRKELQCHLSSYLMETFAVLYYF